MNVCADYVSVLCPICSNELKFRSTVGTNNLNEFKVDKVPDIIAQDLDMKVKACRNCDALVQISKTEGPMAVDVIGTAII